MIAQPMNWTDDYGASQTPKQAVNVEYPQLLFGHKSDSVALSCIRCSTNFVFSSRTRRHAAGDIDNLVDAACLIVSRNPMGKDGRDEMV